MAEIIDQVAEAQTTQGTGQNPFPGLRPFGIDESHLFFGREGQSDEVLMKLAENRFVAVVGASGSGKSSFMYCGVMPILYGGFMSEVDMEWEVVVMRPGNSPVENLADALLKNYPDYKDADSEEKLIKKNIISALLRSSSLGLVEAVGRTYNAINKSVLIVVDQFEELFRFKKSEESFGYANESLAFINLLMEAIGSSEVGIYVALTMRSDFIGECAQFPALTKLINDSHYLIPQMTRDQKRNAIVGPVAVGGGKISQRLVQQLLNDLGDNPDQLPILQHALMRTWDYWEVNKEESPMMDLQHYEAIGKMSEALSQHANEAYDELDNRGKEICESLFKSLTEKSGDAHGIRRPTRLSVIAEISGASEQELIAVIERFRRPGRSLLTPAYGTHLHSNSIIDISHESLMRIWVRLKNWVDEEGEAVNMYLRLSEAAAMYQMGKTGLWRPPDLQLALNWQEKHKPTLIWASRYNPAFERTMVFLETSRKAFDTEQRIKELQQKRALKRSRIIAIASGIVTIIVILFLVFAIFQKIEADKQKEIAKANEKKALSNEKEALKQKHIADQQRLIAEDQKKFALLQKEEADRQAELAKQNAAEADRQANIARQNAAEAIRQTTIAQQQTQLAITNEKKANENQLLAEKNANDAYRQRLLSIAQAMAVKSLQIQDTSRRSLLAQQAYLYNKNNGGNLNNHDIYDALYYSLKNLKDSEYNSLKGHTDAVRSVVFNSTGDELFTVGSDGKVFKWNITADNPTPTLIVQNKFINRYLAISPDNRYLANASEGSFIQLIDLKAATGTKPRYLFGHKGPIWALAFNPKNNMLVSSGNDSTILSRNLENDKYYAVAKGRPRVKTLAVSPDGKYIAGGDEKGLVYIWDTENNNEEKIMPGKQMRKIHRIAFSHNGLFLAAGDETGKVKIWDFKERKVVQVLTSHKARINDLQFSPDDKKLASASFDGTVRVWFTEDYNEQPFVLKDHNSWVWSVAFSPKEEKLVAGCVDNLIRVYPTNSDIMAQQVCGKLKRNMTPKEWNQYVAKDIPYENTCTGLPVGKDIDNLDQ